MSILKTPEQVEAIARAGSIIGRLFLEIPGEIRPGVTTEEIDAFVERYIRSFQGAVPAFKGLYGFPASACISVNNEVVHGIPSPKRVLGEGDLVSVDVGVKLEGWYADSARTFGVGAIDPESERLLSVTEEAMNLGVDQAIAGNRMGDIGHAVQTCVEAAGYGVVRDLVGHGIGRKPHEEPQVPNFGREGRGEMLRAGMVICIEPMVNAGEPQVRTLSDRWTVVTVDGQRSAHFEHTVAIQEQGVPRILTAP